MAVEDTLQELSEQFEDLEADHDTVIQDVEYSDGVLKVKIDQIGTYVLNK